MNITEDSVARSEPRAGVVQLTLSRPEKLNALTQPMVARLHGHLRDVAGDPKCRVVVLTGAGRGFCAGLDLGGFGAAPGTEDFGPVQQTWATQRAIAGLVQELRRLPQPVIAAVAEPDRLAARVDAAAEALLQAAPLSLSLTKQGMWLALEIPSFDAVVELENRQQVLMSATGDMREGMAAYVERRPAEFRNR